MTRSGDSRSNRAEGGLKASPREAAPWIGWAAILAAVVLAALWISRAVGPTGAAVSESSTGVSESGESAAATAAPEGPLEGFRAELGYLPDEELLGFVEVPAGPFPMGSDPARDPMAYEVERWSPTAATGTVDLPTFYMARYEVTVAQFARFVEETGLAVPPETLAGAPRLPVTHVTWPDAVLYARWLDNRLREWEETPPGVRALLDEGHEVRIPSEAEWEKAARGSDGRIFPWGEQPRPDRANYGSGQPAPVGSFPCPECAFPLADMSGNVWEWTRSPYQPYPYDESDDVDTVGSDALWVIRGGSFQDSPQNIRAAVRGGADPGARRPFVGFRVVLTRP